MTPQQIHDYSKLMEFLGLVLGPDYEIALHDLSDMEHSLVAIVNSHISGREVGAPLTNVALKTIADRSYRKSDYRLHYRGISPDGKILRSSTLFLKNEQGELDGLLCINFDDSRYQQLSERVLSLCHPDSFIETNFLFDTLRLPAPPPAKGAEPFHNSIDSVAHTAIQEVLRELDVSPHRLTQAERIQIMEELDARGVFLLKGAVRDVAAALCCSPASVYRYLSKIRTNRSCQESVL